MIRAFFFALVAALVTGCGSSTVDADTRDLLRRDMTAVATAVSAQDYVTANDALRRLVDDTEAAYSAGKLSSSQRSDIVDAAADLQADIDAVLAPPAETVVPVPIPDSGGSEEDGGGGKSKGNDKGNSGNGNGGNGNGKGKN